MPKKRETYPITRNIRRWGKRSYEIGLPKEWIEESGLDVKMQVEIIKDDGKLVIQKKQEGK